MILALQSICLSSCLLGVICFFIVIFHNKFRLYSKILTISIIISCTLAIALWSFYRGEIPLRENANLALLSAPIYFLPGVLLYLYINSVIGKNKNFNGWYSLHFIPFAINIILLVPYFSQPSDVRQQILSDMLHGKPTHISFNVISAEFEIFIKLVSWLVYFLLSYRLLQKFKKKNSDWVENHQNLWYWLKGITIIDGLAFVIYVILLLRGYDAQSYSLTLIIPPIFLLNTSVLMLFFTPKILYGIKSVQPQLTVEPTKTLELPVLQINEYKEKIESFVHCRKVYLRKNYTIKQLSEEINIPLHHLSYVINNELGTNFQNYINKHRVQYIIDNIDKDTWNQYSLEGIGDEAGFNSRNTFFKAFKTFTGKSPAEYLRSTK